MAKALARASGGVPRTAAQGSAVREREGPVGDAAGRSSPRPPGSSRRARLRRRPDRAVAARGRGQQSADQLPLRRQARALSRDPRGGVRRDARGPEGRSRPGADTRAARSTGCSPRSCACASGAPSSRGCSCARCSHTASSPAALPDLAEILGVTRRVAQRGMREGVFRRVRPHGAPLRALRQRDLLPRDREGARPRRRRRPRPADARLSRVPALPRGSSRSAGCAPNRAHSATRRRPRRKGALA